MQLGFMLICLNAIYIYCYNDSDAIQWHTYICGDLNGRIGHKTDFIEAIDNLTPRNVLDSTVNNNGLCFHENIELCKSRI